MAIMRRKAVIYGVIWNGEMKGEAMKWNEEWRIFNDKPKAKKKWWRGNEEAWNSMPEQEEQPINRESNEAYGNLNDNEIGVYRE